MHSCPNCNYVYDPTRYMSCPDCNHPYERTTTPIVECGTCGLEYDEDIYLACPRCTESQNNTDSMRTAMMSCYNCGISTRDGDSSCRNCGARRIPGRVRCTHGYNDSRSCASCRQEIRAISQEQFIACRHCGSTQPARRTICSNCGGRVRPRQRAQGLTIPNNYPDSLQVVPMDVQSSRQRRSSTRRRNLRETREPVPWGTDVREENMNTYGYLIHEEHYQGARHRCNACDFRWNGGNRDTCERCGQMYPYYPPHALRMSMDAFDASCLVCNRVHPEVLAAYEMMTDTQATMVIERALTMHDCMLNWMSPDQLYMTDDRSDFQYSLRNQRFQERARQEAAAQVEQASRDRRNARRRDQRRRAREAEDRVTIDPLIEVLDQQAEAAIRYPQEYTEAQQINYAEWLAYNRLIPASAMDFINDEYPPMREDEQDD